MPGRKGRLRFLPPVNFRCGQQKSNREGAKEGGNSYIDAGQILQIVETVNLVEKGRDMLGISRKKEKKGTDCTNRISL